jgi:hypothetical protein
VFDAVLFTLVLLALGFRLSPCLFTASRNRLDGLNQDQDRIAVFVNLALNLAVKLGS